jgi:protein-tyrosine phosphatase
MFNRRNLLLLVAGLIMTASIPAIAAERPVRIAFVDTGNTGRSITAEALAAEVIARRHLNAQVISRAVALNPYNIHPEENFVALLRERGIDITPHTAATFGAPEAKFSDLILTMTAAHKAWVIEHFPEVKDHVFTLTEYATGKDGEVLDAFGKPMDFYKTVLGQLDGLVDAAVVKAVTKP